MFMLTGVLGAMMVGVALVGLVSGIDFTEDGLPETEPGGSGADAPPQEPVSDILPQILSGSDGDDILAGTALDDILTGGDGDVVSLGDGSDSVLIGDWIVDPVELTDFDVNEDTLLLIYDDTTGDEPVLDLVPSPTQPGSMVLTMNGDAVATLNHIDETSTNSIVLLPQSSLAGGGAG